MTGESGCMRMTRCAQMLPREPTPSEKHRGAPATRGEWGDILATSPSLPRLLCLSNPQPRDKPEHSGAPREEQRPFCQATE